MKKVFVTILFGVSRVTDCLKLFAVFLLQMEVGLVFLAAADEVTDVTDLL